MIASLTGRLDIVLENQKQQRLDLESWLAKERKWNKERDNLLKTIKDLNDIVRILKKSRFVGTSQKRPRKGADKDRDPKNDGDGNMSREGNIEAEVHQGLLP